MREHFTYKEMVLQLDCQFSIQSVAMKLLWVVFGILLVPSFLQNVNSYFWSGGGGGPMCTCYTN